MNNEGSNPNANGLLKMPNGLKGLNAGPDDFATGDFLTQEDMVERNLGEGNDIPMDTSEFPDLHKANSIPGSKRQSVIDAEVLKRIQESKASKIDAEIAKDIESVKLKKQGLPKNPITSLKELIQKGELSETFKMYGITWKMRALDQSDLLLSLDAIKDSLDSSSGRFTALTFAQIVYSIEELDGQSIYTLFDSIKLEDFNNDEQEYIYAVKRALKKYLTGLPPKIIDELYIRYLELDEKRNKALDELKNS